MNNQFKNITTQYRKFSKGQYVKHTQFNEFLDYFEDQDRLSRVLLHGVGIVCGFHPQLLYNQNRISSILLSQGVAITTDGDLLTLNNKIKVHHPTTDQDLSPLGTIEAENKQFTHFKAYDNYNGKYPLFYHNPEKQIELWELATAAEADTDFQPLTSLSAPEDKYLLLYLESYEKEIKPCKGVDCDNHGMQQIRNLKILVTTSEGIKQIIGNGIISTYPVFDKSTAEKKIKRVILAPEQASPESLKRAYRDIIDQSSYGSLFENVNKICEFLHIDPVNAVAFTNELNHVSEQGENFQYAYGALKDLCNVHSEIIKLFSNSFTNYLTDQQAFPKHILLGKLYAAESDANRHKFYPSAALDHQRMSHIRLRFMIERFRQMATGFKNPSEMAAEKGIKITPSQDTGPQDNKAIPFYYILSQSLLNVWNFTKTKNGASKMNLSYNTEMLTAEAHVQHPTSYNSDKKPLYRIEGHQGVAYREAIRAIRKIKDDEQLGFDVVALSLAQLDDNKDINKAFFKEYVEKHPGLEFLGGVKRGGTFCIVYKSEEDPVVIADFALPYMCCTPKHDVALSLPKDTICKEGIPLLFKVSPPNGVVRADVDTGLKAGIEFNNGGYFFNPQLVEAELIKEEIGFLVDGKPTNCTITVLPLPDVQIRAREFAYPEGDSGTRVTFNVSGENVADYDYKWDFLNNGSYVSIKPDLKGDVTYEYLKIDAAKPVRVQVSGGGCSKDIMLTNWYIPEVKQPPKVIITSSTDSLFLPDNKLELHSRVTPGSGIVSYYLWECRNNTVVFENNNAPTTEATFPSEGIYPITLTIRDSNNLEDNDTTTVTVGIKAGIKDISIEPQAPTTNDEITARANVTNPSGITGLRYNWYLDGTLEEETLSNTRIFSNLPAGERIIGAELAASEGNNHLNDIKSATFTIKEISPKGTSFLRGTLITLADGRKVAIETLKGGEVLKSMEGTATVMNVFNYTSSADVYRLNEDKHFITGTHPVRTTQGWKSFEPELTNAMITLPVSLLEEKDILVKEGGQTAALSNTDKITGPNQVYNLEVNGSIDFFANGYSVYSEIETPPAQ